MKETKFIKQNQQKWEEFERLSQNKQKDSKQYSKLFIQITDDLSYARTFYSNRSVRVYLNNLAQNIFHKVFNHKKKKKSIFRNFWLEELPSIMFHHRIELLVSFLVVIVAIAIGILTYVHDPSFAKKILGADYLAMTAENIAKKDPMAVYKKNGPIEMFIMIVSNNLMVDVLIFFSGIFLSIGTIFILIRNGLMLAAFQYYFIQRDLFRESFLAVWLHGTLEISAMVICGAAGIVLGKGLVFPGTYSRTQAFFSSAQRATKIFFSVLPITFVAGIIESFLTRYTNAPDILRLGLIVCSLFFILSYYVYLPWLKNKNGTLKAIEAEKVLPENFEPFEFFRIKKVSEIIIETFRFFRKYTGIFFEIIAIGSSAFIGIGIFLNKKYLLDNIDLTYNSFANLERVFAIQANNTFTYFFPILFSYLSIRILYLFQLEWNQQQNEIKLSFTDWCKINWIKIVLNIILQAINFSILANTELSMYALFFFLPIQFIGAFVLFFPFKEKRNILSSFLNILKSGFMNLFAIHLAFLLFAMALYFLIYDTHLIYFIYEAINMNFDDAFIDSDVIYLILFLITNSILILLSSILFCIYQGLFFFSQRELQSAEGLMQQLNQIGQKRNHVLQK